MYRELLVNKSSDFQGDVFGLDRLAIFLAWEPSPLISQKCAIERTILRADIKFIASDLAPSDLINSALPIRRLQN